MEPTPEINTAEPLESLTHPDDTETLIGRLAADRTFQIGEPESEPLETAERINPGLAPDGFVTVREALGELDVTEPTLYKIINDLAEEYPEDVGKFRTRRGKVAQHISLALLDHIKNDRGEYKPAPDGWLTIKASTRALGISQSAITDLVESYRETNPELFELCKDSMGRLNIHMAPEIVDLIRHGFEKRVPNAEERTIKPLAEELGISPQYAKEEIDRILQEMPHLSTEIINKKWGKRDITTYSPVIENLIRQRLPEAALQDDCTFQDIEKNLNIGRDIILKTIDQLLEGNPELQFEITIKRDLRGNSPGQRRKFYSSRFVDEIKNALGDPPSDEECTLTELIQTLQIDFKSTKRTIAELLQNYPDLKSEIRIRRDAGGRSRPYYSKNFVDALLQHLPKDPSEGEKTLSDISRELQIANQTARKIFEEIFIDSPELLMGVSIKKHPSGAPRTYYSSDIFEKARLLVEIRRKDGGVIKQDKDMLVLQEKFERFVELSSEGKTLEAQEFQKLIQLFGAERAVDILFQYRPEYKKIDVPYVKGTLSDYLGEFLVVSNHLQLEDLEIGVRYLSDVSLKEGLTEVLKKDCLAFYNQKRREGRLGDDLASINEYLANLRQQSADYSTLELTEVIDEVESYYRFLFDIGLPASMVEGLDTERLFPDLNQLINIKQIELKHKMLIADDMGVGKSASAILAKETLGVNQALIIVPSNVIEVWQKYLSDQRAENGDAQGYFKEGRAPRVLTIQNLEMLSTINPADYDYVILSQERLTDEYVDALSAFDYEMLIVDEVHKLKNIGGGKRAENLVKLAARIEDGEDTKYLALLSGTPVPNKVGDIAMILKLLYPEKFEYVSNNELTRQILQGDVLDLRSLLVPRMEMKSLAESVGMPKLEEKIHELTLSEREQAVYDVLLEEDELTATQKLQILRQFILNPGRFQVTPALESTKIKEVGAALRETFSQKDKVVMFVNGYIDGVISGDGTIFDQLDVPDDIEIHVIDGQVPKAKRLEIQKMLQVSGKKMLLAVSGQTADVGVDFSGADELYFYNEPWTEYDKRQQRGRVYRPGLKKDLISHTFYVGGTVEEGIHKYIEVKYNAVEKLLRGIPLSELEKELLKQDERQADTNLEVNPTLAEYYFSKWNRMLKIYNHVKEMGEEKFVKFLGDYGREYAECYVDLGSRSYQSNANRLAGTVIDKLAKSRGQAPEFIRILDVASGPEMLKKHVSDEYQQGVISVDINPHHFTELDEKRRVGSFLNLPVANSTIDYANLSLALHYTKFVPTKQNYERLKVLGELNRVLTTGGVAVINLMHSLDLKDRQIFGEAIEKLGFRTIERYSGRAESGAQFVTRLIVLQKTDEFPQEIRDLVKNLGNRLLQGFKLAKNEVRLKDSRKIATTFLIDEKRKIKTKFNQADQRVLEEEKDTLDQMKKLKRQYRGIKNIPAEEIRSAGFARVFNGRGYVLFKNLRSSNGAVITK